jgi:heterodisulfide reductase subunit C
MNNLQKKSLFPSEMEKELRKKFWDNINEIPDGIKITRCLQCGNCTGSCPVSYAMDIPPRMVIALFRAGDIEKILQSRTIWVCASCYMCTTRCPMGIKITDILYALKRVAMDKKLYPNRFPVYLIADNFVKIVNKYGRNTEFVLLFRYLIRKKPLSLISYLPLGIKLFFKGRVKIFPARIKARKDIRTIIAAADEIKYEMKSKEGIVFSKEAIGYSTIG